MSSSESLMLRHARNDLVKNKGVNLALAVVLVLSAFLMATGAMVIERLAGSVDALFAQAQPPHLLQMHRGDHDAAALDAFAAEHPGIDAWTVVQLYGFDGAAIAWDRPSTGEGGDLSDSLIDNLFVAQNPDFDFLIDESGAIADPAPGEVYAPVAYRQRFGLQAGDALRVRSDDGIHELAVRGFVRDAQMASSLSSATRFVVSPTDRDALGAGGGDPEIIVEYLLDDPAGASDLQAAYEADDALPKNGQAVTYEMIRLINVFSDGLVAVTLVFGSLLLIAIALLNLRFVIRGTIHDEVRQIGAMKAIGLPAAQISRLYLSKYRAMTFVACIVGGLLAIVATGLLTHDVAANYAAARPTPWTFLVPAAALLLVYVLVVAICRGVLRGVRRLEVVNALVHGSTLTERQAARAARRAARRVRRSSLATGRDGDVNRRLALLDLRAEGRQWALLPAVFFLVATLVALPTNLLSTFESPRFVTYMGAPESDVRADVQFSDDVDAVRADVVARFEGDDRVTDVRVFANVLAEVDGEEGPETLRVEVGDYSGGTVDFVRGVRPADGEIAVSVLNADKHRVGPGDTLIVRIDGEATEHVVSGVYQDVTGGGHTAKMQGEVTRDAAGYVLYADVADGVDPAAVAAEYGERFPSIAVVPMQEYVRQTLGHVTGVLRGAAALAFAFGTGIAILITGLFLSLRLARDRRKTGVLSAIGFSAREIIAQVRGKTMLMVVTGTLLGLLFTASLGESLVGGLLSFAGLGLADLTLIPAPWLVYVTYPLVLVGAGYLGAVLLTMRLRRADRSAWLS
ncbi:FtsX-like permease family protein [Microbacterium sp. No. 7]|uniref:FtsX-like permease family protein n=1 Tax=Microbacterium sp. No. 7 TaxID=1714373 RepID=UPI0006D11D26|nr:ABC transporter permease [Microbacterium sp. No. 7]ALJ18437.1 ABC transporter permease [Microbacterium sp. No. 7]